MSQIWIDEKIFFFEVYGYFQFKIPKFILHKGSLGASKDLELLDMTSRLCYWGEDKNQIESLREFSGYFQGEELIHSFALAFMPFFISS